MVFVVRTNFLFCSLNYIYYYLSCSVNETTHSTSFFSYELMFIKGYSKSRYFIFHFNCALLLYASNARGLLPRRPPSPQIWARLSMSNFVCLNTELLSMFKNCDQENISCISTVNIKTWRKVTFTFFPVSSLYSHGPESSYK